MQAEKNMPRQVRAIWIVLILHNVSNNTTVQPRYEWPENFRLV